MAGLPHNATAMRHVVVTGATGFIGSAVVRQLLERGRRVLAVVEPGADGRNLDGLDVERLTADIVDARALDGVCSGAEAVYHLAAVYKIWLPNPEVIYRVNVEGTTAVMLAAQKARVPRVVYTSSIAAVGLRGDGAPSDETVAFNLHGIANDYILTKHLAERIVLRFAAAGLPVVIVNPAFPFGERDRAPTPTGKILLDVVRSKSPGYLPGGFNAVDVEVVALGHLLAEEKGRVGERYLLADHDVSYKEFFALASDVAGMSVPRREIPRPVAKAIAWSLEAVANHVTHREPLATYKAMQYATRHAYFDPSKARRELGLPSRPLRETITRAIAWFRDNGML